MVIPSTFNFWFGHLRVRMDECNSTSNMGHIPLYITESVCVVNTLFLLFIISLTPSLKGFSGALLLNEQIACLIQQVSSIVFLYTRATDRSSSIHETAQLFRHSAYPVSISLLFTININLYAAVCKGTSYKTLVTWKRVAVIITTIWILCFAWGVLPLFYDIFVLDCKALFLILNPNVVTGWWTGGYLLQSCFIITGSILILVKVRCHRRTVQPDFTLRAITATRKKMKLMRLTFVVVMIQSIAFTYTLLVLYSSNENEALAIFQPLIPVAFALDKMYNCFRLCFYLTLYTPMWETTKSFLPCRRVNVNPGFNSEASTQPSENVQRADVCQANNVNVITSFPPSGATLPHPAENPTGNNVTPIDSTVTLT